MKSMTTVTFAVLLLLPGAAWAQDCDVRRDLEQQLDAAGLDGVLIEAHAGSLDVVGADVDRVRVRGVVCASDDDLAAESRLVVERRRDAAWIEADLPEAGGMWGRSYVRMDLTVEMPRSLAADIEDGSGSTTIREIAAVRLDDGSGGIEIRDIAGSVIITDGSGEIRVERVGSLEIDDGSGEIEVWDVRGGVLVTEDGSGEIEIREVAGDVRIEEDGSGSILVVDVGGDFILDEDGSGSVRYEDVRGLVRVPDEGH